MKGIKKIRITRVVREEMEIVVEFLDSKNQDYAMYEQIFTSARGSGKKILSSETYDIANQYGYVHPLNQEIDIKVQHGEVVS